MLGAYNTVVSIFRNYYTGKNPSRDFRKICERWRLYVDENTLAFWYVNENGLDFYINSKTVITTEDKLEF